MVIVLVVAPLFLYNHSMNNDWWKTPESVRVFSPAMEWGFNLRIDDTPSVIAGCHVWSRPLTLGEIVDKSSKMLKDGTIPDCDCDACNPQ